MATPIGKIYSTNITPDTETGIGLYTEKEFSQAVRNGVAKDGRNLYPAMPYPSYTKINDDDIKALYAYFMNGVIKVKQANKKSEIPWPLNMRWPLIFWNLTFLDKTPYKTKSSHDTEWNRGAYLVQGLGHCGACHTERSIGFQEKALDESDSLYLGGAVVENWFASNLTTDHNTGLGRWNENDTYLFLKTGANVYASAYGSMTDVINNSTQYLSDQDLRAIAHYLKSLQPAHKERVMSYKYDPTATIAILRNPAGNRGATLYATYCLQCHGTNGLAYGPLIAPLAGNQTVLEANPASLINVTLNGTKSLVISGMPSSYPMPYFHPILDDRDVADILTFVRSGWNNQAPAVTPSQVAKLRKELH